MEPNMQKAVYVREMTFVVLYNFFPCILDPTERYDIGHGDVYTHSP